MSWWQQIQPCWMKMKMKMKDLNYKKKKILLALMPFWTPLIPPQGICRIKGYLQAHGYTVKTVDANLEGPIKNLYDNYFNTLKEFVPLDSQGNFYNIVNDVWREHMMAHINYWDEGEYIKLVKILIYRVFYIEVNDRQVHRLNRLVDAFYAGLENYLLDLLAREKPGLLGISAYRDTLPATLFAFRLTREKYPHIKTIMGGGIFSIQLTPGSPNLEFFMEKTKDYIDKIVIGPGERVLLKFLQGGVPDKQRLLTPKDIGGKPSGFSPIDMWDYSDFDLRGYRYLAAQGSVSCPNRCSFCNVANFYGEYREKAPQILVEEMIKLYKKYGRQLFHMLDALLNPIITEMAGEFIKSGTALYWDGYFRVDESACDIETVFLWRRAGFYRARIGVESGSQRVLDSMGKNITVDRVKKNIANLAECGIKTTVYVVIGHPGETGDDFRQTLDLVEELKNDIWEAECNPFTYFYTGQSGNDNDKWAGRRILLYPESAKDMLLYQTWIVNGSPPREEMYRRVNRFVRHCKRLGISLPWSLFDVNKSDNRWKRLHKNAVPSVLELSRKDIYIDECRDVKPYLPAQDTWEDDGEFDF
jgi:radical SAM superfamily enzyme YgiQ (UPF0313 family)